MVAISERSAHRYMDTNQEMKETLVHYRTLGTGGSLTGFVVCGLFVSVLCYPTL